jgi:hypothetical protein
MRNQKEIEFEILEKPEVGTIDKIIDKSIIIGY